LKDSAVGVAVRVEGMVRETVVVWLRLPEVPVIVSVDVPVAAVAPTVSVRELVVVAVPGLKDAVTPFGRPDADKLTLPVKPFRGATAMVLEPLNPWATVRLLGDAERLKFAGTPTARETVVVWLRLPEVPVIVTVEVPVAAVALAVSVKELVVVAETGLKDAVTPFGRPDADKLTLPAKPFWGATVMVLEALDPWVTVKLFGAAERPKSGAAVALTVRETVVVRLKLPEVPVIVTVDVPVAAVAPTVSVRELVVVAETGLKDAVTPFARPDADKLTLPVKPFRGATAMVLEPLNPWATVRLLGDAERLKFAGTVTVRETVVVWLRLPEVPVIVTVDVPVVAVALAVSVKELVVVAETGLKDAVTPLGRPDADKLTPPLKPFRGATPMVLEPLAPWATVRLLGDAERLKSGAVAAGVKVAVDW
jgi:hypothetical protein